MWFTACERPTAAVADIQVREPGENPGQGLRRAALKARQTPVPHLMGEEGGRVMGMEPDDDLMDLGQDDENQTIKQMRGQLDAYAKEKRAWEKKEARLAELEQTVAENATKERVSSAASVLPEEFKGLADVFAEKHEGELNADAATAFLQARGLLKAPEPEPQAPGFVPTAAGQPPAPPMVKSSEIDELFRQGKYDEATARLREGIDRGTIEWATPEAAAAAEAVRRSSDSLRR